MSGWWSDVWDWTRVRWPNEQEWWPNECGDSASDTIVVCGDMTSINHWTLELSSTRRVQISTNTCPHVYGTNIHSADFNLKITEYKRVVHIFVFQSYHLRFKQENKFCGI